MLIFDNAPAHVTPGVRAKLLSANIKAIYLPAGRTADMQPLDVGVNGPFKSRCRSLWSEWTSSIDGIRKSMTNERVAIANRVLTALSTIHMTTISNSFRRCGLNRMLTNEE